MREYLFYMESLIYDYPLALSLGLALLLFFQQYSATDRLSVQRFTEFFIVNVTLIIQVHYGSSSSVYFWITMVYFFYASFSLPSGIFGAVSSTWHGIVFVTLQKLGILFPFSMPILFTCISAAAVLWKLVYARNFPVILTPASSMSIIAISCIWIGVRVIGFGLWCISHSPTWFTHAILGSVLLMEIIQAVHLLFWIRDASQKPLPSVVVAAVKDLMEEEEEEEEQENLIVCPMCKKTGHWNDIQCKLCQTVWYCSSTCRTRAWKTHQNHCKGKIKSSL